MQGWWPARESVTISAITWPGIPSHVRSLGCTDHLAPPNFLPWHNVHLHVKNQGLSQHLLQDPGGRVGSEVQGVSQSRAYLMEVSGGREQRVAGAGIAYQ